MLFRNNFKDIAKKKQKIKLVVDFEQKLSF